MRIIGICALLVGAFVAVAVAPMLIFGLREAAYWEKDQVEKSIRRSTYRAGSISREFEARLKVHLSVLDGVADQLKGMESLDPARVAPVLKRSWRFFNLTELFILDAKGREIYGFPEIQADGGGQARANHRDQDYFTEVASGKRPFISGARLIHATGASSVQIAVPILDKSGASLVGVAVSSVGVRELRSIADEIVGTTAGLRYIVTDNQNRVVVKTATPEPREVQDLSRLEFLKPRPLSSPREFAGKDELDAQVRGVVTGLGLENARWNVAVFEPESAIIELTSQAKRRTLIVTLASALAAIVSGAGISLLISRPLVRLTRCMEEQRSRAMESSKLAVLGEMASGISHEVSNPLMIICGTANRLIRNHEENRLSSQELIAGLGKIVSVCERIRKITHGLKSLARDGGQDPFEVVSVRKIVMETIEFCQARFADYGISLKVGEIDESLRLECRQVQISQVILNLLSNALDAVADTRDPWVEMECGVEGSSLVIMVTDSGQGISREMAEKIMKPFYTTKKVGKGTGLGLSISKGIIEAHRGSLMIDHSHPNTRFVVRLPLAADLRARFSA